MKKLFKPGPARTQDGSRVILYTVDARGEAPIIGERLKTDEHSEFMIWDTEHWEDNGEYNYQAIQDYEYQEDLKAAESKEERDKVTALYHEARTSMTLVSNIND